jgi:hypothetical protein
MREDLRVGTRVSHEKYGEGIISRNTLTSYSIVFVRGGEMQFSKSRIELDIIEEPEAAEQLASSGSGGAGFSLADVERAIATVLDRYNALEYRVELGEKWDGGTMELKPGRSDLKGKEVPIEVFFHKIVMLRDRLRVLEQNINAHTQLSDSDKVQLQQYITRIYGSLTTFNILFADKDDYFIGAKGE